MVVGEVEIAAVVDAAGGLGELDEVLPATTDWGPYREAYPSLFKGSQFRLVAGNYLLRSGGRTVLVDTGVGPPGLWDGWDREFEGRLPEELAGAGATPEQVEVVFLTHLHIDHVGWNTDAEGRPFFPNARYVVHRDALAFAQDGGRRNHTSRTVDPVAFEEVDGEIELAPGVTAVELPGHYPGHMGVRVRSAGAEAVILGDAAAHPLLLDRPRDTFSKDLDPERAMATRELLLREVVDRDVLVLCGHYPDGGIGRVVRRDGHVLWTAV